MKRIAIACTAMLAFALAGCGNTGIPSDDTAPGPAATQSGESEGDISVFNVNVNGKTVTCIESYSRVNNGAGVGLSCDFGGATP